LARSFVARPLLSADEHGGDKYKMERFVHPGRQYVASVSAVCLETRPVGVGWVVGAAAAVAVVRQVSGLSHYPRFRAVRQP
jgi:hypothetical protein